MTTALANRTGLRVQLGGGVNPLWPHFNDERIFTQRLDPRLDRSSPIFTMGSCFAVEIRKTLRAAAYSVVPDYASIEFDSSRVRIGALPARENVNHYHTFAIRQEFERITGQWTPADDDIWHLEQDHWFGHGSAVQCPYRRAVYARTPEDLAEATRLIDRVTREGFEQADAFLITLGLTEVWRNRAGDRFACMNPGYAQGGGHAECDFHRSTYDENRDNLVRTVETILAAKPDATIVFTVSPVPLGRTFTDLDVVVANLESKCMLRTAAGDVARRFDTVDYFPSFEICWATGDVYEADGRHVRREVVEQIMQLFTAQYCRTVR
jgi:hypothetical protein